MAGTTKPVSFTLGERDIEFLTNMVEKGRFGNRTEVVRAGLRLLEDYENNEKIKRLRALIAEGDADIKAGRITEYDNAQELESSITN
ncbi:type II toxin-antitoxin system ParD family antitoxin [Nitrosomonas sp.]|uniref:type II toxin-antitoxin system ParD family antitoxin n=1 Tax=Nitrosomonas sp. TaxID=42353 RepID=UPI002843F0E4|nr:type II toxin-antitoxin system ParD family antitoxin [Nitrosomonas sp.]MDR4513663.1 type II toxin-antitoxin system ParD family antitoxin [Nitrosomonas sp.]